MQCTLLGATGLTGGYALQLLQQHTQVKKIVVPVRRPLAVPHSNTEVHLMDCSHRAALAAAIGGSTAIICAIGTTHKKAGGNREAYRRVDYDIPVMAAQIGAAQGCRHFILVSSVGAHPQARSFYLQLKGQVEAAIIQTGIPAITILRPSVLLGARQEKRPLEKAAQVLMQAVACLLPAAYRPIEARQVAQAMVAALSHPTPGVHIWHYRQIRAQGG